MKVILGGATGYIGSAILHRLLELPEVTSVVALTRRPLASTSPYATHPKLDVVVVRNFAKYDPAVRIRLVDATACVWALGGPRDGADVHVDFTFAAVEALWEAMGENAKVRFVYTSGAMVVREQEKFVLFAGEKRKLRGQVETRLLEFAETHPGLWESYIVRPAYVTNVPPRLGLHLLGMHIEKDALAAAAVDLALKGSTKRTWENAELVSLGRNVLDEPAETE